ncbi:MAG: hypothetical protein JXL97_12485 [Bacteroidales bacterium]|nr:hypothetical protein [Bacteroidales bacterium]
MKKFRFFLGALAVLGFVSLFTACNPETSVTLNITPEEDVVAAPGDVVTFSFILTPATDGELGDFSITDADGNELFAATYSGNSSEEDSIQYTVPTDAVVGTDIVLTFTALDGKSGNQTTRTRGINVQSGIPEIVTATNITSDYSSTTLANNMMFDLTPTGVELEGGDYADGELAFVWQTTYGYSVCSPDAGWIADLYSYNGITYSTSDKQTTKIMKYTGAWADLTQEAINALSITSETVTGGGNGVQYLTAGDIIVYETEDGRKGALLVNTNSKIEKHMNADLMFQAEGTAAK